MDKAVKRNKKNRLLFLFLRIAIIAVVVLWAISRIGREQQWDNFIEHFRQEHFLAAFAFSILIFTLGQIVIGLRWWILLRTQSVFISAWAAIKLNFLGLFYNNFMPGSVGGDLIRAWYVTKHTHNNRFEAALSVFVDRIIGLISTLAIAVFFYLLMIFVWKETIDSPERSGQDSSFLYTLVEYKWWLIGILILLAVIIVGFCMNKRGREIINKILTNIRVQSIQIANRLKDAVKTYFRNPKAILIVFGLTVFVQIMVITSFWFLGVKMGIDVSIKYYYVFFTLAWVVGAIPVSIGGAGVVEAFLVFLFVRNAGVDETSAWAIAFCQRAVWMITSLPGAIIHLSGGHLSKDFFVDSDTVSA